MMEIRDNKIMIYFRERIPTQRILPNLGGLFHTLS